MEDSLAVISAAGESEAVSTVQMTKNCGSGLGDKERVVTSNLTVDILHRESTRFPCAWDTGQGRKVEIQIDSKMLV